MVVRKRMSAGVSGAGWVGFALFAALLAVPAAGPAAAQGLTIDTDRTTPVSTDEAGAGDLQITGNGSVTIDQAGPIVTIESDTDVTILDNGQIINDAVSDGVGVYIDLTEGRASNLLIQGDVLLGELAADAELGTNNVGIRVGEVDQLGVLTGNLTIDDSSLFVVSGDNSIGLELNREIVGDVRLSGSMTITGEGAIGVISKDLIDGTLTFRGNVITRGVPAQSVTALDPSSGSGVIVSASILDTDVMISPTAGRGGIYVNGPIEILDGTFTAQIQTLGSAPAMLISPEFGAGGPANIVLGIYDGLGEADPTLVNIDPDPEAEEPEMVPVYSFLNRGTIQGNGLEPGRDATGLMITGFETSTVTFQGGFYNKGVIGAIATSNNTAATDLAPEASNAVAMYVGPGVTFKDKIDPGNGVMVPGFVNEGSITATTSGPAGGMAVGLEIEAGATLPSITNRVAINGRSLFTFTDEADENAVADFVAYGIRDRSDTLTSIINEGSIEAVVNGAPDGSTTTAIAIDVSSNTNSLVINNGNTADGSRAGIINGEIRFGTGDANELIIEGRVTDAEGEITSRASVASNVSVAGGGTATVNIFDGTFQTSSSQITDLVAGRAEGDPDDLPVVQLILEDVPNVDPIISATGMMTFNENARISFSSFSFLGDGGTYALLSADGGIFFTDKTATLDFDTPFLYRSEFDHDANGDTALGLVLERKSAAELGLTGNSAAIYEPAVLAAAQDDIFGRGLIFITTAEGVHESIASLVPSVGIGARAITVSVTDSITGPIGQRQRELLAAPAQGLRFWGQEFYEDLNAATTATAPSYFGSGTGVSLGFDWGSPAARYGISYSYFAGQVTESIPRATKENVALNLVTVYANWRANNFFIMPQVNFGYASYDNRRRVVAGPITRTAISDWNAFLTTSAITTGYILEFAGFQIIPHVSIDGLFMTESGYVERLGGTAVNLAIDGRETRSVRVFAGIAAQTEFTLLDGSMRPQVLAGWSHELIDDRHVIDASFEAVPGSEFSVVGPVSEKSKLIGGAGFTYLFDNWAAAVNLDAAHASGAFSQSASVTMSSRF